VLLAFVFSCLNLARTIVPELPEVETVVRDLRPKVVGRRIASVRVGKKALRKPWSMNWAAKIQGRRIEAARRRGKWIVFDLTGDSSLVFHLGMTGRLTVHPAEEARAPHTHLVFNMDGGEQLRFNDIRRFGSATYYPNVSALEKSFRSARLGPEPFDLDADYWRDRLASTNRCIKAVLLDQTVVAGVGNIYADESLFEAMLHPGRSASEVADTDADRLRRATAKVLRRAIEQRGSSIRNYVGGSGLKGKYQDEFRVYGRTGKACPRCGALIERIRLAGRSTHYCPQCQRKSG
jgi:formamidopyrimidine-DNA glycosylase